MGFVSFSAGHAAPPTNRFRCIFPDTPETTKATFLTAADKQLALARLPPKKPNAHNINPWSLFQACFHFHNFVSEAYMAAEHSGLLINS